MCIVIRFFALPAVAVSLLTGCAGTLAARVVRAPNQASAGEFPARTSVPSGLPQDGSIMARRIAVDSGSTSIRAIIVEPTTEPRYSYELMSGDTIWVGERPPVTLRAPLGTVVMLHGLWGRSEQLQAHALALANAGFRCVLLDLRGHGESTGATVSFGRQEARDVNEALGRLRAAGVLTGRVALFGCSYGGSVALMAAAAEAPGFIAGVVAVAPFARLREVAPNFADRFVPWWAGWLVTRGLVDRVVVAMGEQAGFDPERDSPLAAAPQVRCPVLLLHGAEDDLVPPAQSALLAAALGGPVRCMLIPGQEHIREVIDPGLSLPLALPWLGQLLAPGAFVCTDGPLLGWVGEPLASVQASWAWRVSPVDRTSDWPRPAGGRNLRTWVELPLAWLGRDLQVDLGTVTGADRTWYEDIEIGHTPDLLPNLQLFRRHVIPGWANWRGRGELTVRLETRVEGHGIRWANGGVGLVQPVP